MAARQKLSLFNPPPGTRRPAKKNNDQMAWLVEPAVTIVLKTVKILLVIDLLCFSSS